MKNHNSPINRNPEYPLETSKALARQEHRPRDQAGPDTHATASDEVRATSTHLGPRVPGALARLLQFHLVRWKYGFR